MLSNLWSGIFYSPDGDGGGGNGDDDQAKGKEKGKGDDEVLEYKTWHASQPKEIQDLIAADRVGLTKALGTEREARSDAEKELRKSAKALEKGSKAEKDLLKAADDLAASNTKSEFYEDAHKAGVENIRLAFIVATDEGLFDKRGNANFDKLKESFSELFGKKKITDPNAGDGTGRTLDGKKADMNLFIRSGSGKMKG